MFSGSRIFFAVVRQELLGMKDFYVYLHRRKMTTKCSMLERAVDNVQRTDRLVVAIIGWQLLRNMADS